VPEIKFNIDTWHQAHHLGGVLADAEWRFNDLAAKHVVEYGEDEVSKALRDYAKFFRYVAKEVTKQVNASGVVARSDAINS
jgi:hypothetical protein